MPRILAACGALSDGGRDFRSTYAEFSANIVRAESFIQCDSTQDIHIIGGGLAGCEAAWQVARAGRVPYFTKCGRIARPPAHKTERLAELVCSNSLKSEQENTAPWLLKEELRRLASLLLASRAQVSSSGGHALTVDREFFRREITAAIESHRGSKSGAARRPNPRRRHRHYREWKRSTSEPLGDGNQAESLVLTGYIFTTASVLSSGLTRSICRSCFVCHVMANLSMARTITLIAVQQTTI